jgi:hypothetical protein
VSASKQLCHCERCLCERSEAPPYHSLYPPVFASAARQSPSIRCVSLSLRAFLCRLPHCHCKRHFASVIFASKAKHPPYHRRRRPSPCPCERSFVTTPLSSRPPLSHRDHPFVNGSAPLSSPPFVLASPPLSMRALPLCLCERSAAIPFNQ